MKRHNRRVKRQHRMEARRVIREEPGRILDAIAQQVTASSAHEGWSTQQRKKCGCQYCKRVMDIRHE